MRTSHQKFHILVLQSCIQQMKLWYLSLLQNEHWDTLLQNCSTKTLEVSHTRLMFIVLNVVNGDGGKKKECECKYRTLK